jgi:hypothetical protein
MEYEGGDEENLVGVVRKATVIKTPQEFLEEAKELKG